MADPQPDPQQQFNEALQRIAATLAAIQQQPQQQAAAAPIRLPVLNLLPTDPFDLGSREGNAAFTKACAGLEEKWDGSIDKFPALITGLRDKANEAHWNAAAPQGIMNNINGTGHNLLEKYHLITDADVETAHRNRIDPRARQNARAFYHCLKSTLEGDI
eukprot:scaffold9463_cov122-Cylindrotheca_fusiformis.AAC.1